MKRIFILVIAVLILVGIDIISKGIAKEILGIQGCYVGSPYVIDSSASTDHHPTYNCFQDRFTGADFYETVYADSYYPIFGEFFGLQLSYNPGIAFSLPIHGLPLQILTLCAIVGLFWYFFREEYPKKSGLIDIGYSLIFAGALSHGYERIFVGHVVDFIAVKYFAILNFADIFISVGAFLIVLAYVRYHDR